MTSFDIPDMTCSHCVRSITAAVHAADPAAKVQADLAHHRVQVDSTVPREVLVRRLLEAGYTPA